MFDIGLQELVLIFVIALLVFGPKNLPQLGRSLGRAMREFRKASDEFRSTIETNLQMNEPDPVPHYSPPPATESLSVPTDPAPAVLSPEAAEGPLRPMRRARWRPPSRRPESPISPSAGGGSFIAATVPGRAASRRRTGCTSSGSPTPGTRGS